MYPRIATSQFDPGTDVCCGGGRREMAASVRTKAPNSAEAVFIGGNGLRAVGVIKALEENLDRPILTANQVAFWQALALSGSREPIVGYGRIFGLQVAAAKSV